MCSDENQAGERSLCYREETRSLCYREEDTHRPRPSRR